MFSHMNEPVKQADAVEIKIGQAAKPGLGGHLPSSKMTEEIARIRGISIDEDSISPARHADIDSLDDLKNEVNSLRDLTGGKPIGVKFSAGHVEGDMKFALKADPDFITVDTRGGGTGAAPTYIKDNVSIPAIFALHRARKVLDDQKSDVTLCITGGFRHSSDIAKALAMGADAVALATFSLVGIGCQRYRTCHTGCCPVGIATQDPELRKRFDIVRSVERFVRLYNVTREELINFTRINGKTDVHNLDIGDILTSSDEVAKYSDVEHL
jgi:glutamate synthase domain-containing protein 2